MYNPFRQCSSANAQDTVQNYELCADQNLLTKIVRIPLPRRSLLIFYGQPRYQWEHCILRSDIAERRVIIAYREFTPTYLPGGKEQVVGEDIMKKAAQFWE